MIYAHWSESGLNKNNFQSCPCRPNIRQTGMNLISHNLMQLWRQQWLQLECSSGWGRGWHHEDTHHPATLPVLTLATERGYQNPDITDLSKARQDIWKQNWTQILQLLIQYWTYVSISSDSPLFVHIWSIWNMCTAMEWIRQCFFLEKYLMLPSVKTIL